MIKLIDYLIFNLTINLLYKNLINLQKYFYHHFLIYQCKELEYQYFINLNYLVINSMDLVLIIQIII